MNMLDIILEGETNARTGAQPYVWDVITGYLSPNRFYDRSFKTDITPDARQQDQVWRAQRGAHTIVRNQRSSKR